MGAGRDKDLRLHLKQRLLPQFHRVLGEVCGSRVWANGLFVGFNRATQLPDSNKPQEVPLMVRMPACLYPIFTLLGKRFFEVFVKTSAAPEVFEGIITHYSMP